MAPLREAMLRLLKTWERVRGAHGLHKHMRNTGTRTRGSSQPSGCSGVRALLVPDPERPCLCSASVTSERPPLESLIWLLLARFGAACSPGQAELVNMTLRRRKGETPRCHPAQQRRQEGSERVASCEQQVGEARGEGGEARQMNSIALLLLRQTWLSWQGDRRKRPQQTQPRSFRFPGWVPSGSGVGSSDSLLLPPELQGFLAFRTGKRQTGTRRGLLGRDRSWEDACTLGEPARGRKGRTRREK